MTTMIYHADDPLSFRAIDVVERHARRLGLRMSLGRPRVDGHKLILTAADLDSWVAWRDHLEDEVTTITRDSWGRITQRWAHGTFADITVSVQDPSVYEAPR